MIGIDILNVERMKNLLANEKHLKTLFSDKEIEYINTKGQGKAQTAAGIYAVKEAFFKAVGCGIALSTFLHIEVVHTSRGKPVLQLINEQLKKQFKNFKIDISISHTSEVAVAICQILS